MLLIVFSFFLQGSMLQVTSFVDRVLYYREGFRRGCLHGGVDLYVVFSPTIN